MPGETKTVVDWEFGGYGFFGGYFSIKRIGYDWGYRYRLDFEVTRHHE